MKAVLIFISALAYRLMLLDLKYSFTRWLSVEKKSGCADEKRIGLWLIG
jgi:hypothetical protein